MVRFTRLGALLVLTACGQSAGGPPSSPSADAAAADADATTTIDGGSVVDGGTETGPVNVVVLGPSGPTAKALVVFHDASGAVIHTKTTESDGKAASTEVIPAMVSVLVARGLEHYIFTWVGVEAGDLLVFREPGAFTAAGSYDVTFSPAIPVDGGTPVFRAQTGQCATTAPDSPINIPLVANCVQTANSVLVTARQGTVPVAFSFKKGLAAPARGQSAAVTAGPWTLPGTVKVTLRNAPSGARALRLAQLADGTAFEGSPRGIETGEESFEFAPGFAEGHQANLFVEGASTGIWRALARRVNPGSAIDLDFASALPELSGAAVSGTDVRRPVFSWSGATTAASGGLVRVSYTGPQIEEGYSWSFVVAPGQNAVTAPAMPPEAERFLPRTTATTSVYLKPEVAFMKSELLPTYTSFRRLPGVVGQFTGAYFLPPLTASGALHLTATSRVGKL